MRIAFTGPSGSGKTTLAKWLAEEINIPLYSQSAGNLFTPEDKETLDRQFGYKGVGHAGVISLGNYVPRFAIYFQKLLLERRIKFGKDKIMFVADRCLLDNVVYSLLQIPNHIPDYDEHLGFIKRRSYLNLSRNYDLIFFVPYMNKGIEDNQSRITSSYYQTLVTDIFRAELDHYTMYSGDGFTKVPIYPIPMWDLDQRKQFVLDTIKKYKP